MSEDIVEIENNGIFDELKKKESASPDLEEEIKIKGLNKDSSERSHLLEHGVSESQLDKEALSRQTLLDAGYVFLNTLGGGEKPLINAPELGLVGRSLLTKEELDRVIEYQKQNPHLYSTGSYSLDAVREDMLKFIGEASKERATRSQKNLEIFKLIVDRLQNDPNYTEEDQRMAAEYITALSKPIEGTGYTPLLDTMQEWTAGINLEAARGIPIDMFLMRANLLNGEPSPYLDSGFHFEENPDVTLYPHDPSKVRRLNMGVVHLLSRGLSEMGGSVNSSHDQTYITAGEYVKEILPSASSESRISHDAMDLIMFRIMVRAKRKMHL